MSKQLVYMLAKDLNVSYWKIIEKALELNIRVHTSSDCLEKFEVELIRNAMWLDENIRDPNDTRENIKGVDVARIKIWKSRAKRRKIQMEKKALDEKDFRIKYGETGYTYKNMFGEHLKYAKTIIVEDPYIFERYQVDNFARFCALAVEVSDAKKIFLITEKVPSSYYFNNKRPHKELSPKETLKEEPFWLKKRIIYLENIKNNLKEKGITFDFKINTNMHPRKIILDNGWEFRVDRGLDIYQKPEDWYSLEANDFYLRKCLQTDVLIRKCKLTPEIIVNRYGFDIS